MLWKTSWWKQWIPKIILTGIGLLLAGLYAPFSYDEAFITYRYAANLSRGLGLVYNPGERYLGTTGPGWAILLGGLHRLMPSLSVPQWSTLISGLALLVIGITVYRLMLRWNAGLWALWAAVACMAHPLLIMPVGGEVVPVMALVLSAWMQLFDYGLRIEKTSSRLIQHALKRFSLDGARTNLILIGILAGLATWLRPDAVVAFVIIAVTTTIRRRFIPLEMVAAYGLILFPWLWFATNHFGTPIPGTLATKAAQCEAGLWPCFLPGLLEWMSKGLTYQARSWIARLAPNMAEWTSILLVFGLMPYLIILGFGLFKALSRVPLALVVLAWPFFHTLGYVWLRAPFYPWYATPLGIAMGLSLGLAAWGLHTSWGRRAALLFVSFTVVGYGLWHYQHRLDDVPDPRQAVQHQLAIWFRTVTPPGCSIMGEEIGFLGYELLDYKVYDVWGLVTPGLAEAIRYRNLEAGIQRYQPDYFIAYPADGAPEGSFRAIPMQLWFQRAYRPIFRMDNTGLFYAPYIVIYERVNR